MKILVNDEYEDNAQNVNKNKNICKNSSILVVEILNLTRIKYLQLQINIIVFEIIINFVLNFIFI